MRSRTSESSAQRLSLVLRLGICDCLPLQVGCDAISASSILGHHRRAAKSFACANASAKPKYQRPEAAVVVQFEIHRGSNPFRPVGNCPHAETVHPEARPSRFGGWREKQARSRGCRLSQENRSGGNYHYASRLVYGSLG
jgi:hypothetical protein